MVGKLDFEAGHPGRVFQEIRERIAQRWRRGEATRTYELDSELRGAGYDPKQINEGLIWLKKNGLVRVKQLGSYETLAPVENDVIAQPSPWQTLEEAAEYLRVSPRTIHTWVKKGRLMGHQAGPRGVLRFRREDLDASLMPTSAEATVIDGREDPVLTELWDNEADAVYDES